MFKEKQIEISITPFLITKDRLEFIDYMGLTWTSTPTVIFRHPQGGLRNIFLQPLSVWVWWSILIFILLVSFLIVITSKAHPGRVQKVTFIHAFITTIAVLCQQGFIQNFKKLSTQMILMTSILFSLMIYQFYSSYIVSSLLTDSPKTINTLRKLIDSNLAAGIESTPYIIDFFHTTNDSLSRELFEKKFRNKNYTMTVEEGLKMLKKGGFALTVDTSYAFKMIKDTMTDDEICELQEIFINALIPKRPLRPAVLKKSSLKEFFIVGLQRLKETGIIDYHSQRWSSSKHPKCVKSETIIKTVDMEQIAIIYIFLACAVLTGFGILLYEMVHFRCVYGKKS